MGIYCSRSQNRAKKVLKCLYMTQTQSDVYSNLSRSRCLQCCVANAVENQRILPLFVKAAYVHVSIWHTKTRESP